MAKAVISQDEQSITYSIAGRKFNDRKSTIKQCGGVVNTVGTLSREDASLVLEFANMLVARSTKRQEYRSANPDSGNRNVEQTIATQERMLAEDGVLSTDQISQLKTQGVLDGKVNGMAWNAVNSILKASKDPESAQHARDQLIASLQ